jgi:hypothetical protein
MLLYNGNSETIFYSGDTVIGKTTIRGMAAWSSGIVSVYHRGDWSFWSWDRIPPGYRVVAFRYFLIDGEGECINKKRAISLVKQGEFKVGECRYLHSPSWRTSLFTAKNFFVWIKSGSLSMSAGANPMNFRPIWSPCQHKCILFLVKTTRIAGELNRSQWLKWVKP